MMSIGEMVSRLMVVKSAISGVMVTMWENAMVQKNIIGMMYVINDLPKSETNDEWNKWVSECVGEINEMNKMVRMREYHNFNEVNAKIDERLDRLAEVVSRMINDLEG